LAIDAGLGELGRFGYLIADRVGPRCRLFACLTDMPLTPDRPVDLGAETFCEKCVKCADSCPSRAIPTGGKTMGRGLLRWKMDEEACFAYWGRIGTDCSVCMGVCPYSRPNRSVHKWMRVLLRRSPLVGKYAPLVDNFVYGKRWKSRPVPPWVDYPRRRDRPQGGDADPSPPSLATGRG
jgi:epoxyqueuosine reductase QueG